MNHNFQILKDNKDGTFDIEVPVFKRVTINHPTSDAGDKLTGSSLVYALNNWVIDNFPNTTGDIDSTSASFTTEYGLDQPFDIATVLPELLPALVDFPVTYGNT